MYISKTIYTSFFYRSFAKRESLRFFYKYTHKTLHSCPYITNMEMFCQGKSVYTKAAMQVPYSFYTPKHNDKIWRFVNILMKHGNKTRAIHILEVSAFLFMQTLIKIKMPKYTPNKTCIPYPCCAKVGQQVQSEKGHFVALSKKTSTYSGYNYHSKYPVFFQLDVAPVFFLKKTEKKSVYIEVLKKFVQFCQKKGFKNQKYFRQKRYFFPQQNSYFVENILQNFYNLSIFPFNPFFSIFGDFYFFKVLCAHKYKTLKENRIYVQKPCFSTILKTHVVFREQPLYFINNRLSFFKYLYPLQKTPLKKDRCFLQLCRYHKNKKASIYSLPTKSKWYGNIYDKYRSWDKLTNGQKNTLLFSLYIAISNVKPPLECRNKRFGGSNRQIPATVSEHRQLGYAIRWIVENAKKESSLKNSSKISGYEKNREKNTSVFLSEALSLYKKNIFYKNEKIPSFCFFLADALQKSYYKRGSAIQKRNLWIETANANKAYLGFRWW